MASSVTTSFVYLTIIVGRTGTSIAHNNKREEDEHKHQTLKCTNCSHYAFDSLHSVKLFRQNFWIIQHSSHGFSDSQVTNSPTLLYDVCGVKAPANKTLHPSPQGYPVFSNVLTVHRGQTSRAVFRFISRHFIHNEVELWPRLYIILNEMMWTAGIQMKWVCDHRSESQFKQLRK